MKNFQLIIPINRETFIENICSYYSKTNIDVMIVHNLNKNFVQFETDNIKFYYSNESNFLVRILEISDQINSEYCQIFSDDDFIFETNINDCINFLKINRNYSSAQGLSFGFDYNNASSLELYEGLSFNNINRLHDSKIKNIRLFHSFTSRYVDRAFSIMKKDCLISILNSYKKISKTYPECWELYFIVCLTMAGRDIAIQDVGWIKGQHEKNLHKTQKTGPEERILTINFLLLFHSCLQDFSKAQKLINYSIAYLTVILFIYKFKIILLGRFRILRNFLHFVKNKRNKKLKYLKKNIFEKYINKIHVVKDILK